jgi:hypothetical protein
MGSAVGVSSSPAILRGSLYTSLATDARRSSFECRADSEENQGKRLRSLLVHMTHDGCLQYLVEAFHESISRGVVGGCLRELNTTQPGQELEKLRFKLTSLVGGDGLRATEEGYQPVSRARATVLAVMSRIGMTSGQQVKRSTAVRQYV